MATEVKLEGLEEVKKMFSGDLMRKTLRSTLDKSATEVKKEIGEEVAGVYEIKPADVKKKIQVQRTTLTDLETSLNIRSERPSLVKMFKGRQASFGVLANVRKGSVSFYRSAFIVTAWHKAMIRRGRRRLPIDHRAGPSVTEMVNTGGIIKKIEGKWYGIVNRIFESEVERRMRSGK
jgi:hypothetical protein